MAEETVNVYPKGDIEILRGEAPAPERTINPADFQIATVISGPRQYLAHFKEAQGGRTNGFVSQNAVLCEYNFDGVIRLKINHRDDIKQEVIGAVQEANEVERLQLTERFTLQGLAEHLKMNKDLCPDHEQVAKIVTQLKSFRGTVTQVLAQDDKQDGSRYLQLEQKFQHDIPQTFTVSLPPYKGAPAEAFTVEILMDVRDGQVSLWLQSYAYKQAHHAAMREVVKKEIKEIEGMGYLCLQT